MSTEWSIQSVSHRSQNSLGETSTSNLNVSPVPYQAHLVLDEVSQELYLAGHASQLPFIIQCGYFLKMELMRLLKTHQRMRTNYYGVWGWGAG